MHTKILDTFHKDYFIQRYAEGFQLCANPLALNTTPLDSLLNAKMNIYFLNRDSQFQYLNEHQISTLMLNNMKDAFGKSCFDIFRSEDAAKILQNDQEVVAHQKIKIIEEEAWHKEGYFIRVISAKAPWYNSDGDTIGLFGCSIILDNHHSIIEPLNQLMQLGFLTHTDHASLTKNNLLSLREKQCLYYLVRGKTAREIALLLNLSPRTVEHYIKTSKAKLDVKTKSELIEKLIHQHYHS